MLCKYEKYQLHCTISTHIFTFEKIAVDFETKTRIGQLYNCHQTKESFDLLIKGNWGVFQNQRKQA